jgi:hypothetical protein
VAKIRKEVVPGRRVLWAEHVSTDPRHLAEFWAVWEHLDESVKRRYLAEARVSQKARLLMLQKNPLSCSMSMKDVIEETRFDSRTGRRRPIMQRVAIAYSNRRRCRKGRTP